MLKKIKELVAVLAITVAAAVPVVVAGNAAAQVNIGENLNQGTCLSTDASTCTDDTDTDVNGLIAQIINIFSFVVGVVAVVMVIIGGFQYVTSGGASDKVTGAKNTIMYAIIGLVIVAFAQFIVRFVLNRATGAAS